MSQCKNCSCELTPDYANGIFDFSGTMVGPYCGDCWGKMKACTCCNQIKVLGEDITLFGDNSFLCTDCKKDKVQFCNGCGEEHIGKVPEDGTEFMCKNCSSQLFKCDECGNMHLREMSWSPPYPYDKFNAKRTNEYPGIHRKFNARLCEGCFHDIKHRFKFFSVHECGKCGVTFNNPVKNSKGVLVTKWCPKCFRRHFFECGDCGVEAVRDKNSRSWHDPNTGKDVCVCGKCAINYFKCSYCSKTHYKKDSHCTIDPLGRKLCSVCVILPTCKRCAMKQKDKHMSTHVPDMCTACASDLKTCSSCGTRKSMEAHYYDDTDNVLCRDCACDKGLARIWGYNHKPSPLVHGVGDDLIVGIENELCCKPTLDKLKVLSKILPHFEEEFLYAKFDSSVFNGFELVTQPMTFEYFKSINWDPMFPSGDILTAAEVYDINHTIMHHGEEKSQRYVGFHIHLSKRHFTTYHLYKFINFLYRNHKFAEVVAEREANKYCHNFPNYSEVKNSSKMKLTADRGFVYMPHHTKTVELRFFAGCHNKQMLIKNVEFVQSLFEFTLNSSTKSSELEAEYRKYVEDNTSKFPFLAEFLGSYK